MFVFFRVLEQAVYELTTWLLFYPYTLIRIVLRPVRMMRFVLTETNADPDTAFGSAMRPALFLLISIALGSLAVQLDATELEALRQTQAGRVLGSCWPALFLFLAVISSLLPLAAAVIFDLFRAGRMTRDSLRVPFYQQCYIGAPLALVAAPFIVHLDRRGEPILLAVAAVVALWFVAAQYLFFRRFLGFRPHNCIALTLGVLACGAVALALAGALLAP